MTEHDDALPDLDLGVLGDDVAPSPDRWKAIESTAAHRRRRRSVVLGAAAALVLIAATATVLVSRSGHDGVDLATGASSEPLYLIPPADSEIISIEPGVGYALYPTYSVRYQDASGIWTLASTPLADPGSAPDDSAQVRDGEPLSTETFGTVYLTCGEGATSEGPDSTEVRTETGPHYVQFEVGGSSVSLTPVQLGDGCDPGGAGVAAVVDQLSRFRMVDETELRRFLGLPTPETPVVTTSTPPDLQPPAVETTLPENPPDEPAGAEAEISDLIQDYTVPAADGTYPKLEDGVERADEYREILDLMKRRAGTDQLAEPVPNIVTLTSIQFRTPTDAVVVWDNEVTLPGVSGAHFSQQGRATLQDGRWVVSYETILNILERACVPPGGHDPSCTSGPYAVNGTTGG